MNYKHLHYFWTVVRLGGVLRAAEQLHLTPQTLSGQIRLLEERVGQPLLRKAGRGVEPTEAGRLVAQYADEIFTLGQELEDAVRGAPGAAGAREAVRAPQLRVGIVDAVPKAIAYHLVEPALRVSPAPRLQCTEGKLAPLLGEIALRRLDLVIADVPMPGNLGVKAYTHLLGRSAVAFFAAPRLLSGQGIARRKPADVARVLARLPLLMPGADSALRPRLDAWLRERGVSPQVAGEFDDTALMKAFARQGAGAFAAPAVLSREICAQYDVVALGPATDLVEEFYAISPQRRITQPAIQAITSAARGELFVA